MANAGQTSASGGAPAPRPPDLPPVPRASMSRFAQGLLVLGVLVIVGYAYAATTGWEPAEPQRDEVPATVRASTGGYRSFHFWHSGYHGGK
jgi:hypothetical protein